MKKDIFLYLSLFLMLNSAFVCKTNKPNVEYLKYVGNAYTIKSNSFFYVETHQEVKDKNKHVHTTITYTTPNGEVIGFKKLDYSNSYTQPNFKQEDYRNGFSEGAELVTDGVKLFHQEDKNSMLRTKTIKVPQPFVIDGGFNYFIKNRWSEIESFKIVSFYFVVPNQMDYFSLRLRKKENKVIGGKNCSIIYLEIDNVVLRWIVKPIILTYDTESKRLLTYEGISNIMNAMGKNEAVKINYPELGP
jgi:hypothetical protein